MKLRRTVGNPIQIVTPFRGASILGKKLYIMSR